MKTNQIMTRPMGQFTVQQRTKDSMFFATNLINQWNEVYPNSRKQLIHYLTNQSTQELISAILDEEFGGSQLVGNQALLNTRNSDNVELVDNQVVTNDHNNGSQLIDNQTVIDSKNSDNVELVDNQLVIKLENHPHYKDVICTSKARADRGGGTWMHPILFIDFAMWLNARFKYEVLKFVSDQMLFFRDNCGEQYKKLSSAVQSIIPAEYNMAKCMSRVSNGLNYIVFGKSEEMERNLHGTQQEMYELFLLEKELTDLIEFGAIKTFGDLIKCMGKKYRTKYPIPECLEEIKEA